MEKSIPSAICQLYPVAHWLERIKGMSAVTGTHRSDAMTKLLLLSRCTACAMREYDALIDMSSRKSQRSESLGSTE